MNALEIGFSRGHLADSSTEEFLFSAASTLRHNRKFSLNEEQ
jgi:hypothetical protein